MGMALLAIGVVALAAGLVIQFIVAPDRAQFPDDVDTVRNYEGELGLMLDADALANQDLANIFIRDVPVTIERSVKTLEVDGGKALVNDNSVISGPAGPILGADDTYTIDRKTMTHIENFADDDRVIDREGLVVGFPIGTDAEDYVGFNGDTLTANTISFVQEEAHEGIDTYVFTAASGPDVITDPEMLAAFPAALPKAAIEGMVPALGLPDEVAAGLAELLPALPDPVPLTYTYTYETMYWVEPDSGVLVDYDKLESRSVAIDLGGQLVPMTEVMQLEYAQTEASVAEAIDDAEEAKSALFWQGRVLPYGLMAGGALAALLGLGFMLRRPDDPDDPGPGERPTPDRQAAVPLNL